jgi:hypothetical protein
MSASALSAGEKADLAAFFESLTDRGFLTNPSLTAPGPDPIGPAKSRLGRPNEHGVSGTF